MIIYIFLCLFVVIIVVKKLFAHYGFSSNIGKTYSWSETLSPFNPAPKNIYKHLSPENKGAFWSIISSVIIGVLSCWLGFSVQFFVYNSTRTESSKLAHYQVVDKFRPIYLEMFDSCSYRVFEEYYKTIGSAQKSKDKLNADEYMRIINGEISPQEINTAEAKMLYFLSNKDNWEDINHTAKKCIEISGSIAPYLDSENSEKLLFNNSLMLVGSQLFETLNSTTRLDSLSFVNKCIDEYIRVCVRGGVSPNTNLRGLYETGYSLYKNYSTIEHNSSNSIEKKLLIMQQLLTFSLIPMMDNVIIITNEFSPKSTTNKPMWISVIILLVCVFIGYMLFRIILMRFFDKKSLEPNPKMSQSDLDKLNKELTIYKKENVQYDINLSSMSAQIKQLKTELGIVTRRLEEELGKNNELQNSNNHYIEEINKLKQQLLLSESQNREKYDNDTSDEEK